MKILIVDDELLVRRSLQRACVKRGHEVQEAEDGRQGLEVWRKWNPDLVFLDVLMPKLSGLEVLRQVPDQDKTAVILMSAFTGNIDMSGELSERADLFLPKPFQDIFAVVDRAEELIRERGKS